MKLVFLLFLSLNFLNAIVITGNQDKVSVTNGGITVTGNDGITQNVNSGEITFINEQGASKARRIQRGDLNDIYNDLKASDDNDVIKVPTLTMKRKHIFKYHKKIIQKYNR
jgi:hypothetical protein